MPSRRRWAGVQVPPEAMPKEETQHFDSFAGGFDARDAQEDMPDGTSPDMRDVEITRDDRLVKAPGITTVLGGLAYQPKQLILHAGPSYSSELLLFSPPVLGVYRAGAVTWSGVLPTRAFPYSFANFAGVGLFSNGPGALFAREARSAFYQIADAPGGFAVGVFANRVIVGGTTFQGSNVDLMRVVWNDVTGNYRSWDLDQGSADQVLIGSSTARADRIQAFAYLGFNTLVVVCRRSIWIGQPTGDINQPIDFQLRLIDTGCRYPETIVSTEFGVLFLADDGVRLFDGNSAQVVSDAINPALLPTSDTDTRYSASFDPQRKRYYLCTPTETWILDLLRHRWFHWCVALRGSAFFPTQSTAVVPTWGTAIGTWGSQTQAWWELNALEQGGGDMHFIRELNLGIEDPAATQVFGTDMNSYWRSSRRVQDNQDRLITHLGVRLSYEADAPAQVQIQLPAMGSGDFEPSVTADLAGGADLIGTRRVYVPLVHTGRGLGLGLKIVSGDPHIRRASLAYQDNGEQLGAVADIASVPCAALPADAAPATVAASITITPTNVAYLANGGTFNLTAVVKDNTGAVIPGAVVTWETDNVSVATVVSTGNLTATATGGATQSNTRIRAVIAALSLASNDCTVSTLDEYVVHKFLSDGPFTVTAGANNVRALLVGGGSGGVDGGGGAGGFWDGLLAVTPQVYNISVGQRAIGAGAGGDSKFGLLQTAFGGAAQFGSFAASSGAPTSHAGGMNTACSGSGACSGPGGGGGAGGVGSDGTAVSGGGGCSCTTGGGGQGLTSDITGTVTTYCQGGTIGRESTHYGDGGGGEYGNNGIVIIRYLRSTGIVATGGDMSTLPA